MKKSVILLQGLFLLAIFLFSFISAAQTISFLSSSTGEAGQKVIYNISIVDDTNNLNQVNITFYNLNITTSSVGSSTAAVPTQSGTTFTFTGAPLTTFPTTYYFWFDATEFQEATFKVNVTTTDAALAVISENKTITISDTINPVATFVSPTPADDEDLGGDYVEVNISVDESGSGVRNVTFYLSNSTGLFSTQTDTSAPYFYNFTGLNDDTYSITAKAYDYANNSDDTPTRTVQILTGNTGCLPAWTCSWSECINGTQTQTNCTDANNCGFIAPAATQACESCVSNWDCGEWIPAACSSDSNQTRLCTDLNSCEAPETETRTCVVGGDSTANASGLSLFSSSTLFFVILGLIVASVLGVIIFLIRLKKKSSSANSGFDSGYSVYSPPRGPPSFPPSGYANPPQSYPNQPQNY